MNVETKHKTCCQHLYKFHPKRKQQQQNLGCKYKILKMKNVNINREFLIKENIDRESLKYVAGFKHKQVYHDQHVANIPLALYKHLTCARCTASI